MAPRSSHGLDDHGDSLPSADAGRGEAIAAGAAAKLIEQSDYQARARSTERMAEGDRAAIHVGLVAVESQRLFYGQILRGESFIHFHQVCLFQCEAGALQRFAAGGDGTDAHDARLDTASGPGDDAAERLPSALARSFFACDHYGRSAVGDAAGVGGGA